MTKINIIKTITGLAADAQEVLKDLGVVALAATTVVGMTELADHQETRVVTPQPVFAFADNTVTDVNPNHDMRKEREEVSHRPVSYGITMRSHATSGKR